jgi:hypothetical protein
MAIFRRNTSELPESQVEYSDASGARQWIALAFYILLALAVAVLVVLAGRWVYHKVHNSSGPNPAPVAPQGVTQAPLASPNTTKKALPPSSTNKTPSPTPTPPAPNRSTTTPGALPNNGPGDVVALFAAVSLAAAGLHYIVAIRRVQN